MTYGLLLVCFFLSGFSALLYETAWTREFAFVFGTSELAVVAVLAAYMAGLALGAAVAARWAPRVGRPVLVYGFLELGIALGAIGVPAAVTGLRRLYLGWLGGLDALPEQLGLAVHAFHLLGTFAVLVPCTALMGATLPLLARFAVARDEQIGPRVGQLYAVNTAGAVAGTLTAAFVLLPALGLRQTVWVGAAVNALVFAAAAGLARLAPAGAPRAAERARGVPWILPAIAVSGAVSFGYEVLWVRLLGQLLGTSTAAFATMLATFLTGIALGSALASRWARTTGAAAVGFAAAQLATAITAWLGFLAADALPELAAALDASADALAVGALLGAAVLLPLTLCIGASFPFAVRLLARDAGEASASSARVYAWNTVGSICGAVGAGYWLLPGLGLENTLRLGVAANLALAGIAAARLGPHRRLGLAAGLLRPSRRLGLAAGLLAVWALLALATWRPDALLRRSPFGATYEGPFTYFAVGRSATVALIDGGASWRLTTNGLPESLLHPPDYPFTTYTARWLSLLPVLQRPDTRDMLIVGLGGGITTRTVPSSVERIEVIELEPEVVAANRAAARHGIDDPLADPRVRLRLGDARGALILADRRYDAIVSQPSHPWTSGASHLYTREFFELASARLTPDGVFVQWIGDGLVDDDELRSLLAALGEAFAHVELYRPPDRAHVMIASQSPFDIVASAARALAAQPADFAVAGLHRVEDVVASLTLDAAGSRDFAGDAEPNTDDRNRLATRRPRRTSPETGRPSAAFERHDPLPRLAPGLDPTALTRRLLELRDPPRARRVATSLPAPERPLALGWLAFDSRRPGQAHDALAAALEARPDGEPALAGLALVDRNRDVDGLSPRARAVVLGQRAIPGDWAAVRALDAELARWRPGELLFREAVMLRATWRVELGETRGLEAASQDLDQLLRRSRRPPLLLLQARLHALAGHGERAWLHLDALRAPLARGHRELGAGVRTLVAKLPEPRDPRIRERLERALAAGLARPAKPRGGLRRPAPTGSP